MSGIGEAQYEPEQIGTGIGVPQWFAVQVKPRHEFATAKLLRCRGFEQFVPVYTSRRQWSDRTKEVVLPLFTGYVFSKFCGRSKLAIVTTAGVIRIVGSRKGPIAIPEDQLNIARRASESGESVRPHPYSMPVGTRVRIKDGPMAGVEGYFLGHDRSQLIISVDMIQRSMCISIEGCSLDVVDVEPDSSGSVKGPRGMIADFRQSQAHY
jgi:transcription termination/antitermination protein NusG